MASAPETADAGDVLSGGSYDLLVRRLAAGADELAAAAAALDADRTAAFATQPVTLAASDRLATDQSCVARDMVAVAGLVMLGYHAETASATPTPAATFALYEPVLDPSPHLVAVADDDPRYFLNDPVFVEDFAKLHRFYGKARFTDLRLTGTQLLAVFSVGERVSDIQVFRWKVTDDDMVVYVDARGDRDYRWPEPHELDWVAATREDQRSGAYPVVSVLDDVFVGFRNGRLQLRNRDDVVVIDESVVHPNQSLTDVAVNYASSGDVLVITVAVYAEPARTYVFSRRTTTAQRCDSAAVSSRVLPGGEGIVFAGGVHLAATGTRTFDVDVTDMMLEEVVSAPNGEDSLYVYHRASDGEYLLMPYNTVRREMTTPIVCHGFALIDSGQMVTFRATAADSAPSRSHPVQWWDTPFAETDDTPVDTSSFVGRVTNAALVAALGAISDVVALARTTTPTRHTFETVAASARRVIDTSGWVADPEAHGLADRLAAVSSTAGALLDEFAAVERRRAVAANELAKVRTAVSQASASASKLTSPADVVAAFAALRAARSAAAAAADVPDIDTGELAKLTARVDEAVAGVAEAALVTLDAPDAFTSTLRRITDASTKAGEAATTVELATVTETLDSIAAELDATTDALSSLVAGDPAARARVVRALADTAGALNRARAAARTRHRDLSDVESAATFDAELALVSQRLDAAVAAADSPAACDTAQAAFSADVERLDSRFGDSPERADEIDKVRIRASEAFTARRGVLADERSRRVSRVADAAERVLAAVVRHASGLTSDADIETWFATDRLPARVSELADELATIGETARADSLRSGLRTAADTARRRVRDAAATAAADGAVRLGRHRLTPNREPFEVVLSSSGASVAAQVSGTSWSSDVSAELTEFADLLAAPFPSETPDVSRAEYLAWATIADAAAAGGLADLIADASVPAKIAARCAAVAERRHADGYQRGVHDHDAARIIGAVASQLAAEPLLRSPAAVRAWARVALAGVDPADREQLTGQARAAVTLRSMFAASGPAADLAATVDALLPASAPAGTAEFIVDYLASDDAAAGVLVTPRSAATAADEIRSQIAGSADVVGLLTGSAPVVDRFGFARELAAAWVAAAPERARFALDVDETAVLLCGLEWPASRVSDAVTPSTVTGLVSDHPRIDGGQLTVRLDALAASAGARFTDMEARWPSYTAARQRVVSATSDRLRLDEHRPRPIAGFVRNSLIDAALLPALGANLARQIGSPDSPGTATSGAAIVISPPGYGKTTLVEWVAERLGMLLVKVNGPALGTATTSLDPASAPDAAARAEVEKINLALRMGRNVILYVDDIQHCSPELLSRFIPLADATRRVEGVVDGQPHTFDLRGQRFALLMAGNPYTSTGARFVLPDMLTNRSDVIDLSDVAGGFANEFAASYLANSTSACPPLAVFGPRLVDDLGALDAMAAGTAPVSPTGLAHVWDGADLAEAVNVIRLLRRVRDTLLLVNGAYVASAATAAQDRTVPPFLLQGSYRNMARIASRVVPAMTDDELDTLVDEHYAAEAATLSDAAEQNLLAYKRLVGRITPAEAARWDEIVAVFTAQRLSDDPAARVSAAIDRLTHLLSSD